MNGRAGANLAASGRYVIFYDIDAIVSVDCRVL